MAGARHGRCRIALRAARQLLTWLERPERAQQLIDQQVRSDWPALLNGIARSLNPQHETSLDCSPCWLWDGVTVVTPS